MINVGDRTIVGMRSNGQKVYGIVTYIHPKKRFLVAEYDCPYGIKLRTAIPMGLRRGQLKTPVIGALPEVSKHHGK